jgi:NAD(P)-dependent dehydrogenase (short-subunit alcohol dehydrogenase family)
MDKDTKTVIVTGGAQGIGCVVAKFLLEAGYGVAVLDQDREALKETEIQLLGNVRNTGTLKDSCSPSFLFLHCDISNEEEVLGTIQIVSKQSRRIYGLVNNAAISRNCPLEKLSLEDWNRVLSVNLTGPFLMVKHAAPFLREARGSVVNICSSRALMSESDTEAYSASKGGLLSLTHALAVSLGPWVRVNAVSPGWIEVSAYKKAALRKEPVLSEADHSQHPAGRVGKPEDVARMVLFLLDPENSFITGQNFIVDGGMTKKMIYV